MDNWRGGTAREPVFELPGVLIGLIGGLVAVHVLRGFLAPADDDLVLALFAFIPDRYVLEAGEPAYPGGWGAMVWSFVSHAALHGSWMHLVFNAVILAAVGKPVVMRIGRTRFLALVAVAAAAGAAAHLAFDLGSPAPMIGASGVVFGLFGALLRFAFASPWRPTPTAFDALKLPRVQRFVLALIVMNLVMVVIGTAPFGGGEGAVAWAAHLGGFLPGFFGFRLFDRPQRD